MRLRPILRWAARLGAGAVGLALVGAAGTYGLSERRLRARFAAPDHPLVVPNDPAAVARGAHLATIRGCTDCHGANLGGRVVIDDPMVGVLAGPNLTRGGRGAHLTPRDWERAVRHGLRRDGSPLAVMPSQEFTGLTDEDLAAIVAYAQSVPAVGTRPPPVRVGPAIRAMLVARQLSIVAAEAIDHQAPHPARLAPEPTARYGAYLAAGCTGCHGPGLSGGKIPGAPPSWGPAANITPAGNVGRWSEADFVRALRTARRPDGSRISTAVMPIETMTSRMTDVELRALYAYLRTVPARPYGMR